MMDDGHTKPDFRYQHNSKFDMETSDWCYAQSIGFPCLVFLSNPFNRPNILAVVQIRNVEVGDEIPMGKMKSSIYSQI